MAFRIQEQKVSRKDLNDLLSRDLLEKGQLELHEIFFLKGNNNGALRKYLNLLVFYLRDNESDAVTNHTTKIIKQVKGNWQPIATPKCARNAAAIEAAIAQKEHKQDK